MDTILQSFVMHSRLIIVIMILITMIITIIMIIIIITIVIRKMLTLNPSLFIKNALPSVTVTNSLGYSLQVAY